jgi:hypothetical protein
MAPAGLYFFSVSEGIQTRNDIVDTLASEVFLPAGRFAGNMVSGIEGSVSLPANLALEFTKEYL